MSKDLDDTNPGNASPVSAAAEFALLVEHMLEERDKKMEKRLDEIVKALGTITDKLMEMTEERRIDEAWRRKTDERLDKLEAWRLTVETDGK